MVSFRSASFLFYAITALAVTLATCRSSAGNAASLDASQFTVVDLDSSASAPLQLAVQACAGLSNRMSGGSVYVDMNDDDQQWLDELGLTPDETVDAQDFLNTCVTQFPACVRYSYQDQQALLPNILTVAAALEAVPLDTELNVACGTVAFDATVEFKDYYTPDLATQYVIDNYLEQTTGLAMLDPGYDQTSMHHSNPPLTRDMSSALVDYVFSQKLFVVFLNNACIDSSPESELLSQIVNSGQWPTPVTVYGYNDAWYVFGGYLFEAETLCLPSRNMGQVASMTENLSFFSTRRAPITKTSELPSIVPESVQYDPSMTYVAFVVGDGDNVSYMMSTRRDWFSERVEDCAQPDNSCAPLTWTISPHMPYLAPDVLQWYYESAQHTGQDWFTLPPSGHLYAYPASLNADDQDRFVTQTEQDASLLGVHGTVDWEWFTTWRQAEADFLPKYATAGGAIRGVFAVNVPYLFPIFTWWGSNQFYEVLSGQDGGRTVLFRPREWRGVDGSNSLYFPTPQMMADQLGSYPAGTVTWVYMTSDGGLSLENSFMPLVKLLPPNVQFVSADAAAELALAASGERVCADSNPLVGIGHRVAGAHRSSSASNDSSVHGSLTPVLTPRTGNDDSDDDSSAHCSLTPVVTPPAESPRSQRTGHALAVSRCLVPSARASSHRARDCGARHHGPSTRAARFKTRPRRSQPAFPGSGQCGPGSEPGRRDLEPRRIGPGAVRRGPLSRRPAFRPRGPA